MKNNLKGNCREIKVSYATSQNYCDMQVITSALDAEKVFRNIWSQSIELREECYALFLNRANRVLGWYLISIGGSAGTVVDPKIIFSTALICKAQGIIMAHNHPSGNTQPSAADLDLTKKLVEAAKLLEIGFLDHLILTKKHFYSFADEGLI